MSRSGRHAVVTMLTEIDMSNPARLSDLLSALIDQDPDTITAGHWGPNGRFGRFRRGSSAEHQEGKARIPEGR